MIEIKPAFICDLDGTLALFKDKGHRGPFDYGKVSDDELNEPVAEVVRALYQYGYIPVYLSGRESTCRTQTLLWLQQHKLPGYWPLMREPNDNRSDVVVKRELYDQVPSNLDVKFALDDRNQVVELWRSMSIPCFQVAEGDF